MARVYPSALVWLDIETPNLPDGYDFSNVPIMEIAGVVTDFELTKFSGYHECVKLERRHADLLKANPDVMQMHKDSGLIKACSESNFSVKDLEEGMLELLQSFNFQKGEFIMAGSGVAAFDMPLVQEQMPELASWFTYYTVDIGILRRVLYHLGQKRKYVKPVEASFKGGYKKHRAMDDVLAHIEEAVSYKDWLLALPEYE